MSAAKTSSPVQSSPVQFSKNISIAQLSRMSHCAPEATVGFGWLVDEVVWACAIVVLSVDVDI